MSFFTLEISGSISGKLWLMLKKWGFIDRNTAGAYTAGRNGSEKERKILNLKS